MIHRSFKVNNKLNKILNLICELSTAVECLPERIAAVDWLRTRRQ